MTSPPYIARQVVELLEQAAVVDVVSMLAVDRRPGAEENLERWGPALDQWLGTPRQVIDAEPPSDDSVVLEGPNGRILVRMQRDGDRQFVDLDLIPVVTDGVRNIVVSAPGSWNEELQRVEGGARDLAVFYGELLGMTLQREDWMVIAGETEFPRLAFGDGWSDDRPPRWPDPEYPHQLHLDIAVRDLDAAGSRLLEKGASLLHDAGGHRTFADPVGHPFCLYPDASMPDGPGRIARLVFDCAEPAPLARFWAELLDMPRRIEESADRVVIASADGVRPALAFQRVEPYVPPRWDDSRFPQPIHLDLMFNDYDGAKRRAEELGAQELPPPRGSCPVYADPAGHPFCLCSNAGGDEPYVAQLLG